MPFFLPVGHIPLSLSDIKRNNIYKKQKGLVNMQYGKRYFNLSGSVRRGRQTQSDTRADEPQTTPRIPRGTPYRSEESSIGSFLIRVILCITIFSGITMMKNSDDPTVGVLYDALSAWSTCNYSIPEEYGLEKFVSAIKQGDILAVFSPDLYPTIQFPTRGEVTVSYGEKTADGAQCLGVMISSDLPNPVKPSAEGVVTQVGENAVLGKYIVIQSGQEVNITYGCCDSIMVSMGDEVDLDTVISQMARGEDGNYHIYMEVRLGEKLIDPEACFSQSEV